MDPLTLLLIFLLGILASFLNGFVGGGGSLISIPALIMVGLPPQIAIGTNRFGLLGTASSSIVRFAQARKIVTKYLVPLIIFGTLGSILGAMVLVKLSEQALSKIIGVLMLILLPIVLFEKKGLVAFETQGWKKKLGYGAMFLTGIYGGFFGAGAGIFGIVILISLFGMTYVEANATEKIPWFISIILTVIIFAVADLIVYSYGIALLIGMILGGYLGAHIAVLKGNKYVRVAFTIVVFAMAAKLLF